jgi:hypothetical protein
MKNIFVKIKCTEDLILRPWASFCPVADSAEPSNVIWTSAKENLGHQYFGTRIGKVPPTCREIFSGVSGSYVVYHG